MNQQDITYRSRTLIFSKKTQIRLFAQEAIEPLGIHTTPCDREEMFYDLLGSKGFNLAIVGHGTDDINAIDMLKELSSRRHINLPVIVLASSCSIEDAIKIMQAGAEDLLLAPWEQETVRIACERAIYNFPLRLKKKNKEKAIKKEISRHGLIYKSKEMEKVVKIARNIAPSKASVLIQGESGTGKEVMARFIHENSDRKDGPFVALNCASLPDTLLESELFGHEKGAFTGAISRKKGKFELANHGTILLDEVTEMAFQLQAKLLRVLQEGEVDRVGGSSPVPVDVRVIATTNRDIKQTIKEEKFREDLYFRLNVIPLVLPPLRERREDIPILADYFLRQFSAEYGKTGIKFASSAIEYMMKRDWKGNIRELRNIVERGVLLAQGDAVEIQDLFIDELSELDVDMQMDDVSDGIDAQNDIPSIPQDTFNLGDIEREVIKMALKKTEGNRTHAAKLLGISVRTLRNKLAEYRKMGLVL